MTRAQAFRAASEAYKAYVVALATLDRVANTRQGEELELLDEVVRWVAEAEDAGRTFADGELETRLSEVAG